MLGVSRCTPRTLPRPQNSRRGDFSRAKVRGKRALELGAGMGLAGMALALLGAGAHLPAAVCQRWGAHGSCSGRQGVVAAICSAHLQQHTQSV